MSERWSPDLIEAAGGIENVPAYLRMEADQRRRDIDRPLVQFLRVVAVSFRRGEGVPSDPVRIVTNYFDNATGRLLFEDDPIREEPLVPDQKRRHDPTDHDCRGGVPGDRYPF